MDVQSDWMSELDFCWLAEDESNCVATFSCKNRDFLDLVPLVRNQHTKTVYQTLLKVLLDVLPVINTPKSAREGHSAQGSARGFYEYEYVKERKRFELVAMPITTLCSEKLRLYCPESFDALVLKLATIKYASRDHIDLIQINLLLVCRERQF